jgi:hypothetical protein
VAANEARITTLTASITHVEEKVKALNVEMASEFTTQLSKEDKAELDR